MARQSRPLPGGIDVQPRKMSFEYPERIPEYWYQNDPVPTHFFHSLSILFPEGERFFMDSVRHYEKKIMDPELRRQVKGFMGQEGQHSKEHLRYNRMLAEKGYNVAAMEGRLLWGLDALRRYYPRRFQLAITCALEHFTAIMAHVLLSRPEMTTGMDPHHAEIWKWHAIEETEHKAVAFDVYRATGGSYWTRIGMMLYITGYFIFETDRNFFHFLFRDKLLFSLRTWWSFLRWGFIKPGFLRRVIPLYFQYFRPNFHPWNLDNARLVAAWKAEHPGPDYSPVRS